MLAVHMRVLVVRTTRVSVLQFRAFLQTSTGALLVRTAARGCIRMRVVGAFSVPVPMTVLVLQTRIFVVQTTARGRLDRRVVETFRFAWTVLVLHTSALLVRTTARGRLDRRAVVNLRVPVTVLVMTAIMTVGCLTNTAVRTTSDSLLFPFL
jgi:hypothetical protein